MDKVLFDRRNELYMQSLELYEISKENTVHEGSQILINEAFKKGFLYIEPEIWVPLNERKY